MLDELTCTGTTSSFRLHLPRKNLMKILAAIKQEERKLEKEFGAIAGKIAGSAKGRGSSGTLDEQWVFESSDMSRVCHSKSQMSRAAKKRWAKVMAGMKKL